uniref:Uncharacterized protein n=1 Tax=Panagrolaimus davidi TaxID=227884 RepID=A0A914Q787_9BILA
MSKQCLCDCKKSRSNDPTATTENGTSASTTTTTSQKGERTSLYKVIMSCMTDLNETDHFYQFPMSYSYQ